MSPLLFNFFIMDLLCPLTHLKSAPKVQGVSIPILLFADDCVILSESAAGLQDGLCMMWDYCEENGLTVNTSKTKVMSLGTTRNKNHTQMNVMYGEEPLEQVNSFVYLGVEILESGSIHSAEAPLVQKANRA